MSFLSDEFFQCFCRKLFYFIQRTFFSFGYKSALFSPLCLLISLRSGFVISEDSLSRWNYYSGALSFLRCWIILRLTTNCCKVKGNLNAREIYSSSFLQFQPPQLSPLEVAVVSRLLTADDSWPFSSVNTFFSH